MKEKSPKETLQDNLNSWGFFSVSWCGLDYRKKMRELLDDNSSSDDVVNAVGRQYDVYRKNGRNNAALAIITATSLAALGVSIHYQFEAGMAVFGAIAVVAFFALFYEFVLKPRFKGGGQGKEDQAAIRLAAADSNLVST